MIDFGFKSANGTSELYWEATEPSLDTAGYLCKYWDVHRDWPGFFTEVASYPQPLLPGIDAVVLGFYDVVRRASVLAPRDNDTTDRQLGRYA